MLYYLCSPQRACLISTVLFSIKFCIVPIMIQLIRIVQCEMRLPKTGPALLQNIGVFEGLIAISS